MVLNPIIQLILAVISGVAGILLFNDTDSWFSFIPCLVFVVTFFFSLALPGIAGSFARYRAASRRQNRTGPPAHPTTIRESMPANRSPSSASTRLEKLTPDLLRSHSRPPLSVGHALDQRPPADQTPHVASFVAGT